MGRQEKSRRGDGKPEQGKGRQDREERGGKTRQDKQEGEDGKRRQEKAMARPGGGG